MSEHHFSSVCSHNVYTWAYLSTWLNIVLNLKSYIVIFFYCLGRSINLELYSQLYYKSMKHFSLFITACEKSLKLFQYFESDFHLPKHYDIYNY